MADQEEFEETKEEVLKTEEAEEEKIPVEDMDARILEAFYRSLLETVRDAELPLEPSDYLRNYFSEYVCDQF